MPHEICAAARGTSRKYIANPANDIVITNGPLRAAFRRDSSFELEIEIRGIEDETVGFVSITVLCSCIIFGKLRMKQTNYESTD